MADDTSSRTAPTGTVLVLGATGQQGGAVARALSSGRWRVRALVRDPGTASAVALAARGVELARGDLADTASLRAAMTGLHGVFSVQPSSGQPGSGVSDADELTWGTTIVDLAVEAGVKHLLYGSAIAAGAAPTGVGHFDTKARIEDHLRRASLRSTVMRPATFMEILDPAAAASAGELVFFMAPQQSMQFIAVADIGRIAAAAFDDPEHYGDTTLDIAGDEVTGGQLAAALTRATRRLVHYRRFSPETLADSSLLAQLAALVDDGPLAGSADIAGLRASFPGLVTIDDWLADWAGRKTV